jgi:hypothetical protein
MNRDLEAPLVDARHYRPFWRRRPQIDRLRDDRAIRPIDYRAAVEYRELAESIAARAWGAMRIDATDRRTGPRDGATVRHFHASQRLLWVRHQIGTFAARLCDQVIIADVAWAELGRRYHCDPKTARAWGIAAVQLLPAVMFRSRG